MFHNCALNNYFIIISIIFIFCFILNIVIRFFEQHRHFSRQASCTYWISFPSMTHSGKLLCGSISTTDRQLREVTSPSSAPIMPRFWTSLRVRMRCCMNSSSSTRCWRTWISPKLCMLQHMQSPVGAESRFGLLFRVAKIVLVVPHSNAGIEGVYLDTFVLIIIYLLNLLLFVIDEFRR